jgi:hypothetical protein
VPVLFVPVFIYRKEFRWVIYYGLLSVGIAWVTTLSGGIGYYLEFLGNLGQWHPAALRSSSIYSFIERTHRLLPVELPVSALSNTARVLLGLWVYALSYLSIRRGVFTGSERTRSTDVINGLIPLMFLMPVLSPTVWVHHLVVLILPAILMLVYMSERPRLGLWCTGYFFTFLLPTFDLYPWSYLRLAGWLSLLVVLSDAILRPRGSPWIGALAQGVDSAVEGVAERMRGIL